MEKEVTIENSIIKTYKKVIWSRFIRAIKDFKLINEGDNVAVCISGGKDSFLLAKLIQELQKHSKVKFGVKYIIMNPGYNKENLELIKENVNKLHIDAEVFDSTIFADAQIEDPNSVCYVCARKRRGNLYKKAQDLNCNKIALGHHFDDVIETTLLSMLYGGEIKTMLPKLHSDHYENMELIRPMYYIKEQDIINWVNFNKLTFMGCSCPYANQMKDSKRLEMKNLIKELRKKSDVIDINIFRSMENINLNMILGYNKDDKKYYFLDDYEKEND